MASTGKTRTKACCRPGGRAAAEQAARFTALCKVLGHEARLGIVGLLLAADEPLCACEIEACFDLSQPTISHHLRLLRDADLVANERRGTWIHYSLSPTGAALAADFATWLGGAVAGKEPTS